jgi:hypothetical protein
MNTKQAVELLRLIADRLEAVQTIDDIKAEVARTQANRDQIHGNIVRQAKQEAAAETEKLLTDARTQAKALAADAQQEAEKILRDTRTKAAQLIADGEDRLRGLEANLVLEKARALLSEKAAA